MTDKPDTATTTPPEPEAPRPIANAVADACVHTLVELGDNHAVAHAVGRIAVNLRTSIITGLREYYATRPAHMRPVTDAALVDEAHQMVRRMWTAPLDAIAGGPSAITVAIRETR